MLAEIGGAALASSDHPAIAYATGPVNDPIAQLDRKIQAGQVQLKFEGVEGYLRSVLQALSIPIESQMVVFSKTSLQMHLISPRTPRTIFFNDQVVVAWVPHEPFIEVTAEDSRQGVIFYSLDQKPADRPAFARHQEDCTVCHESYATLGVPGMLVRSVFPDSDGRQMRQFGEYVSDHRSPFEERWGGWYVTGKQVSLRHMGNTTVHDPNGPNALVTSDRVDHAPAKVELDPAIYLSGESDVVALLVFDHQMQMINLLTRIGWDTRFALYQERMASPVLERTSASERDLTKRLLQEDAQELVDYLLFIDEAPLEGRVEGSSGFARKFAARGPRDHKGRSLRDFDLQHRLMRYPCSYMIYSPAFDALPAQAKAAIYERLWQILSGHETSRKYSRLSLADRQAMVEILRDTKPDLPDYFQAVTR